MEFNWKEVDIDEIILKCINNTREYKFKFSNLKNDLTIPAYCTKQSLTECLNNLKKIISVKQYNFVIETILNME